MASGNHDDDSAAPKRRPVPLTPAGDVTLPMTETPPRHEERREIHPRRPLPEVPDQREDETPS
jgi:hypothetical protein